MLRPLARRTRQLLLLIASAAALAAGARLAAAPARSPAAPAKAPAALPAEVMSAGKAIEPSRLEGHVRVLADDKMEGRGTGTRGYDMAAQYVAEQMQAIGLQPGGKGGRSEEHTSELQSLRHLVC